jgi:hypothetical protein
MAQPQDTAAAAAVVDAAPEQQNQDEEHAAQMIQRNYRGYRERRQLQGIGLDASARWAEVRTARRGDHVSFVVKGLIFRRLYETVSRPSSPPPPASVRVLKRAKPNGATQLA